MEIAYMWQGKGITTEQCIKDFIRDGKSKEDVYKIIAELRKISGIDKHLNAIQDELKLYADKLYK